MSETNEATPAAPAEPVVLKRVYRTRGKGSKRTVRRRVAVVRQKRAAPEEQEGVQTAAPTQGGGERVANSIHPDEPLTRRTLSESNEGRLSIDPRRVKPGWDVEWKVITVYNQPVAAADLMAIHYGGWRQERAGDWPELVMPGTPPDAAVEQYGQRLYGRPKALTLEAREEYRRAAEENQLQKMQAASTGRLSRASETGEGLGDMGRIVRPTGASLSIEGEVGVHGQRR